MLHPNRAAAAAGHAIRDALLERLAGEGHHTRATLVHVQRPPLSEDQVSHHIGRLIREGLVAALPGRLRTGKPGGRVCYVLTVRGAERVAQRRAA